MTKYQPKIGLEIHLQLKTATKMFCACPVSVAAAPNTNICPVCTGQPGSLPVPNFPEALNQGLKIALALKCKIAETSKFDRKNYFYPDLPKGYQISQYDEPIARDGLLSFDYEAAPGHFDTAKIGIERVHLEEDTGKLTHHGSHALLDLNRAGTPLAEIVTKPDIKNAVEAKRFAQELQVICKQLEVSDAALESGQMRVDVNVSLTGTSIPSYKVEVKNLNSFSAIEKAVNFEIQRQTLLLGQSKTPEQETRGWSDAKGVTVSQRSKELSADYRYFPEPDIPRFNIPASLTAKIKQATSGHLPQDLRGKLISTFKLEPSKTFQLEGRFGDLTPLLALFLKQKSYSDILAKVLLRIPGGEFEVIQAAKPSALESVLKVLSSSNVAWTAFDKISWKKVLADKNPENSLLKAGVITKEAGKDEVDKIVAKIISENPSEVAKYRAGKTALIGFFIGKALQLSGGKASAEVLRTHFEQQLTK